MLALLSLVCLVATSTLVLVASPLRSLALRWIGFFVLCCAQIVAVTSVLGLIGKLALEPLAVVHLFVLGAAVAVLRARRAARVPTLFRQGAAGRVASAAQALPTWLRAFALCIGAAYALSLLLALVAPVSIQDAMTYYLGRVGFWLQQHSLAFFPTNNLRQTTYPPNVSLLFAWTILLCGGDSLVQLAQWLAAAASALAVYCLAGQIGAPRAARVFSALLWASAPIVVLESSSAQIDLVTTAWVTAACVFAVEYLRRGGRLRLALAALSSGLAVGAKFTALILLPGAAAIAALALAYGVAHGDRRPALLAITCAAAILCLGSFVYVQSRSYYGSATAARSGYGTTLRELFRPLAINGARYTYQLIDTSGFPPPLRRAAESLKYRAGRAVLGGYAETLLSDEFQMQEEAQFGRIFRPEPMYVQAVHPDRVSMGLLGPLLVALLPAALLFGSADRRLVAALGILFVSFCGCLCVVAGFHYFHCRYNATAFALLAPLASQLYFERGRRQAVSVGLAAVAVVQCWTVLLVNENRPFVGHRPWWRYDRIALATISHPENDGILRAFAERVPEDAAVGVATTPSGWVFPFFGASMRRRVFHVAVDDRLEPRDAFAARGIRFLYVRRARSPVLARAFEQEWLQPLWEDDLGVLFAVR